MSKIKIAFDQNRCTTCHTCSIACAEGHAQHPVENLGEAVRNNVLGAPRTEVRIIKEKLKAVRCVQCAKPKCVEACTSNALSKNDAGFIIVDDAKCVACWDCIDACPFDAAFKDEARSKPVMCDLCTTFDVPFCVSACPTNALSIDDGTGKTS